MALILEDKVTANREAFTREVIALSERLGIDPNWLMWIMWKESNLNPAAVNKVSGATGLIQFMPATARNLGTSVEDLRRMSNVEQLKYVEMYLRPYKGRMKSVTDTYFAVFFPVAIGRPDTWVLQTSNLAASTIARQNAGMDTNKDNQITVGEVSSWLLRSAQQNVLDVLLKKNRPVSPLDAYSPTICGHCGKRVVFA